jgi:pterin-4a-carbinolamine dehydratase
MNVGSLMSEYFDVNTAPAMRHVDTLPVEPHSTGTWDVLQNPNRLHRRIIFQHPGIMAEFVAALLEYQETVSHYGVISIEAGHDVDISVYTHTLDDITELDHEYAHMCDEIYNDVMHYGLAIGR